jgi:hypothetical protein
MILCRNKQTTKNKKTERYNFTFYFHTQSVFVLYDSVKTNLNIIFISVKETNNMKKLNFIKKIIPACLGIVGIGAVAPIVSTTINVSKSVSNSGKTINVEINNPPNFNPAINAQKTYSFYSDTIPEDITNIGVDEEGYVYTNMGN